MRLTGPKRALAASGLEGRIVWILGSGRSGSTWLLSLLRSLDDVVPVNEPLLGAHLAAPLSAVTSVDDPADATVYDESRGRDQYVFADQYRHVWLPRLRRLLLDRLAAEVVTAGGSRRSLVVVKEPNGSLAAPLLRELTPRSRLLFLVRDGRDVIDSSLDAATARWSMREDRPPLEGAERAAFIERRARHWVRSTEATWAAYEAHDPSRRLLVQYEPLRHDTASEVTRIVAWLGRTPDADAIRAAVERLAFESIPPEKRGAGQFTRAATPGLWRERFSATEQELLGRILGPTLARVGY